MFKSEKTLKHEALTKTLARRGIFLQEKLGEGGFGAVHKGICDKYSSPVAIKVIEFSKDPFGNIRHSERVGFELEVQALAAAMQSEYVVDLKNAFTVSHGEKGIIVMELGDGMDLSKYIYSPFRQHPVWEIRWIASCIARGIADLHALNIVHRDLKGGNVILFKGADGKFSQVKILDFGMAANEGEYRHIGGTLHYMCDDRLQDYHNCLMSPVIKADDIFAFGCIMLRLLGGGNEFIKWNAIRHEFRETGNNRPANNPLVFPSRIRDRYSEKMMDALQRCLHGDAEARPTAVELLQIFETKQHAADLMAPQKLRNDAGAFSAVAEFVTSQKKPMQETPAKSKTQKKCVRENAEALSIAAALSQLFETPLQLTGVQEKSISRAAPVKAKQVANNMGDSYVPIAHRLRKRFMKKIAAPQKIKPRAAPAKKKNVENNMGDSYVPIAHRLKKRKCNMKNNII